MRALTRYADPVTIALAALMAVGVVLVQEGPLLAIICGGTVIAVGLVAEEIAKRIHPKPSAATRPWYYPLTPRQSEYALLIVDGLTDKEIAERLSVGLRGVEAMVQAIFNKLSDHTKRPFTKRLQVALWVKERQAETQATVEAIPRTGPVQR